METLNSHPSSYRDPAGIIFISDGELFRRINSIYFPQYRALMSNGLYGELSELGQLVEHSLVRESGDHLVIKPEKIPFISYPYEWSFDQLKDAALLTLDMQLSALEKNMTLKDATAYNVQFLNNKPIFIDTLSFEFYKEGAPWVAYGQFCRHFLAPLALMSSVSPDLNSLLKIHIDGIPLDMASKILPLKSYLNLGLLIHIHLQSKLGKGNKVEEKAHKSSNKYIAKNALIALLDSLKSCITKLKLVEEKALWEDYYNKTNYTDESLNLKRQLVQEMTEKIGIANPVILDLGANDGFFSRAVSPNAKIVISTDFEAKVVNSNYLICKKAKIKNIFPMVLDIVNPAGSIGWENKERDSIFSRINADLTLALALIHHLAIGNNVPFLKLASFFAGRGSWLIIEFVPKEDSQVQRMLAVRNDIFDHYSIDNFKKDFQNFFEVILERKIQNSKRTLFLLKRINNL